MSAGLGGKTTPTTKISSAGVSRNSNDQATKAVRVPCVQLIAIFVGGMALLLAGIRVNLEPNEPFDRWGSVIRMILVFAIFFVAGVWAGRRSVQRDVLPRKRRLEALLKELDAP